MTPNKLRSKRKQALPVDKNIKGVDISNDARLIAECKEAISLEQIIKINKKN